MEDPPRLVALYTDRLLTILQDVQQLRVGVQDARAQILSMMDGAVCDAILDAQREDEPTRIRLT